MMVGSGSASAVLCCAAAAATCATASSSCAVVGADCCMPSRAPRMTLITTVQANDTPATAADTHKEHGRGVSQRRRPTQTAVEPYSILLDATAGVPSTQREHCWSLRPQCHLIPSKLDATSCRSITGMPCRAVSSPKGMRRWRGTTEKLTSCAGTQMVHRALQLSHSSARYFS